MTKSQTTLVFREMVREEWRLHSRLFGGRRFAAFPVVLAGMVAGGVWLLAVTGTDPETIVAGLHLLALVFGLHTGSIGLVGRDAMADLLGDLTLLVFAARTLPFSQRRLLGLFVAKDVAYYAVLFMLPMAAGTIPASVWASGHPSPAGFGTALGTSLLLWVTLVGTFVAGIGSTLSALGLSGRGTVGRAVLAASVLLVGGGWIGGLDLVAYTPYGVYLEPTVTHAVVATVIVGTIALVGIATFDVQSRVSAGSTDPVFGWWQNRVGDALTTKTLLDVHRSSGGFGKVLFSAAILFGVIAALVDLAGTITGVAPSVGVSFGTILGLTAFTTYNWLTQFDDVEDYVALPVDVGTVFAAKRRAFVLLGPVVGLAFYGLALWWRRSPLLEGVVGAVLLVGVAAYSFGVTIYLTGLSPNEFLFDTARFLLFGAAVALPLVPILVVGFALGPLSSRMLVVLAAVGMLLGGLGLALYRRSIPKWTSHHRTN